MKNVKLRHTDSLLHTGRIYTTDAAPDDDDDDEVGAALAVLENSGLPIPEELAAIRDKLARFGSPTARTSGSGIASADAARSRDQRTRRAAFDAQCEHTRKVAARYREFWDSANSELADAITR